MSLLGYLTRPARPERIPDLRDVTQDTYRVLTWSCRSRFRWGWRVQVDFLTAWQEHGDQSLLSHRAPWFRTQDEAIQRGMEVARRTHEDDEKYRVLPLVIHLGDIIALDERNLGGAR